jgi:hypothetical protein
VTLTYLPLYKLRLHINDVSSSRSQTPDNRTAAVETERVPVVELFRFDGAELNVKAPPEIRHEIKFSKPTPK